MKKHIFILTLITLIVGVNNKIKSQTPQQNLDKYWHLRYRFVNYFEVIGMRQGYSDPGTIRNETQNGSDNGSYLYWGDGPVTLGYYIGVLATEYRLLADNHQDVTETVRELYYALHTVYRLDSSAYTLYTTNVPGPTWPGDGCMLRDDAAYVQFQTDNANYYTQLNLGISSSDPYSIACSGKPGPVNALITENTGFASVDNYLTILMGLSLVKQLVDNYTFSWQEYNSNTGQYYTVSVGPGTGSYPNSETIYQMDVDLAEHIFNYLSQQNWCFGFQAVLYPDGTPIKNDGNPSALSYPLYNWANNIFNYSTPNPSVGAKTEWNDYWDACGSQTDGSYCSNTPNVQACEAAAGSDAGPNSTSNALDMINFLGSDNQCSSCSGTVWEGRNIFWSGALEVLYRDIYDISGWDYCGAETMINLCPYDGPFYHPTLDDGGCVPNGWGCDRRFGDNEGNADWSNGTFPGSFSGLDYMLLYNIYYIMSERESKLAISIPSDYSTIWPNPGGLAGVSGTHSDPYTISRCENIDVGQLNVFGPGVITSDAGDLNLISGSGHYIDLKPNSSSPIDISNGAYFDASCSITCCESSIPYISEYSNPSLHSKISKTNSDSSSVVTYKKTIEFDTLNAYTGITAYPNPFNAQSTIAFSLKTDSPINIYITDITGKKVKDLVKNSTYGKGTHTIQYNGVNLAAGTYICVLDIPNGNRQTLKIIKTL